MDKSSSNQKQHSQHQHLQQTNELDESITSSQCINQISSISTTDSKNSLNSIEKKATHSEIEKRRRQKMNKHLNELAFHLPGINTKSKKPDKLTILKLAVQHLKNLKASNSLLNDSFICQNFMKPIELQSLVLNETEEFFIVIKCDSSKIVFVSDSCANSIGFTSNDLIDKSFYDFTHSSDHKQIKEQLNYQETNNNPVDSTNNYTNNRKKLYTTGDRRSFLCRIRNCLNEANKNLKQVNQLCIYTEPDFKLAHFVGYMRTDFAAKFDNSNANTENLPTTLDDANDQCSSSTYMSSEGYTPSFSNQADDDQQPQQKRNQAQLKPTSSILNDSSQCNGHFLLAYAQVRSKVNELDLQTRFITKHDADGKFIYIEPSIYPILGYLPQQLLTESIFSFVHLDDVQMLKKVYQEAILTSPSKLKTPEYRVRLENNKSFAIIESVIFALKNPFTNNLEYVVSQNKFCSISLINNSNSYANQQQQQQQLHQQTKQKAINSPLNSTFGSISMPMTPSPEDTPSPEMIKYNESIHGKKLPTTVRPKTTSLSSTNSNIPVGFNSKLKQKNTIFQIDANNNILIDSEMNSTQLNILPIASTENQIDIFKNSQPQQQRSSQDSFINFSPNANLTSQDNNLYNESITNQQLLFDINDSNFNDILTKNQSASQSAPSDTSKSQSAYNLMLKNNTVQENAEMLMEIFKNEKNFQTSSIISNNEKS